ncbi:MAG: glutamate racemase [Oscillospiraceae bacterium]|nr:glutamate racemase [Oscillospiraceae bacterium]
MEKQSPIGFFDSGLGGISVLKGTMRLLPGEDYVYYGDSANAPYGIRTVERVQALSRHAAEFLLEKGAKALVIACNTATSAAAAMLREEYPELAIIGTEPAVKPAVQAHPGGRILVMATAMTLQEQKFFDLWGQFRDEADIVPVPCTGLMEFVERGIRSGPELETFLLEKLEPYTKVPVDAVVLGCTHYPFLTDAIRRVVGSVPKIYDSADGVARQLGRRLEEQGLLNDRKNCGTVTFFNSSEDEALLRLSRTLLETE